MRKWWIVLLACTAMLLGGGLSASAAEAVLWDEGHVLTEEEYDECLARLQKAADATDMNVAVLLAVRNRSDYSIETTADSTYDELFGRRTDGLLYYMDLSGVEPYDYISTSGMGQFYYTNSDRNNRVEEIFSELDYYLYPVGSEDARGAVLEFASLVEFYRNAGIPERYYVYDELYDCYYYVENGEMLESATKPYIDWDTVVFMGFAGLVVGIIAALGTFFGVKSRYKFKSTLSPTAYVNRKSVQYHQQYDNFIRTYTTKVKIETSSGGGGGGGGGRSFGGHGGGGHHR